MSAFSLNRGGEVGEVVCKRQKARGGGGGEKKEEEEEEEEERRRRKVRVGRAGICRIWKT